MYYYTVCYFTSIFYAVVRQISMLFIDSKYSVSQYTYSWNLISFRSKCRKKTSKQLIVEALYLDLEDLKQ